MLSPEPMLLGSLSNSANQHSHRCPLLGNPLFVYMCFIIMLKLMCSESVFATNLSPQFFNLAVILIKFKFLNQLKF